MVVMLQIQVKCLCICIHWVKYTKDSQHLVLLINTGSLNYLTTMHTFLSQKKQEYLTFFPLVNTFLSLNKFKFLKSVFVMDQNCFPSDLWSEKVCQTQLHAQQMRLHNLTILLRKPVQQNTLILYFHIRFILPFRLYIDQSQRRIVLTDRYIYNFMKD